MIRSLKVMETVHAVNFLAQYIRRQLFHVLLRHRAGVAVAQQRTAGEGDVHVHPEQDIEKDTQRNDAAGNDQKQLAMSDKIEFFSHARLPPSSQGFRMHLKRVMDFSISREAVTPIRKLKTIPANRV